MDDPDRGFGFLRHDVAVDASLLVIEILARSVDFLLNAPGNNGQGDELRMRVLQHRACRFAMIFAEQQISQSRITPEIQHAVAIGPKQIFYALLGHIGERLEMLGALNDYLVRADAVHLVVQALGFACEIALNPQNRKFI
jgi:hypothetical protein